MAKTIVMSLGGSLIAPKEINIKFLKKFRQLIIHYVKKGNRVVVICGGGNTCRNYQNAAKSINARISATDLDWVGIAATKINAEFVRVIFGNIAYENILINPSEKVKTNKKIIIGGGYLPGSSSDKDAVLVAKNFGAQTVINLSNINYVYDKDPNKYKDAKPQKEISWKDFLKIVGNDYVPGAHWPFDPVATRLGAKLKMELVVINGGNLPNLEKFLAGRSFIGTTIR